MKCTSDFSMNLALENVMKIENFHCMQSFHDIQTVFSYCDGYEFFAHFHRTAYISSSINTYICPFRLLAKCAYLEITPKKNLHSRGQVHMPHLGQFDNLYDANL